MDWKSVVYALVIFVIFVSLLLMWAWPRNRDGSFMSMEEVDEFLKRFPRAPSDWLKHWIVLVFATLGMIGAALTHHEDHDNDHH